MSPNILKKWDRKEKLMVWGTALTLTSILVSAFIIYAQIKQGNALTWKAALESQSNEFAKLEVNNAAIACVFKHNDREIDNECTAILKKSTNRRQALMYVSQVLSFFGQLNAFSRVNDREYAKGYGQWITEISHLDITSYYLYINKIDAKRALKIFGIIVNNADIEEGYARFKQRINYID
jgi:hypothetical protein